MITSSQLLFGSNVRATNLAAANTHQASVEQPPLFPQDQEQSDDAFIDSFFNNSPTPRLSSQLIRCEATCAPNRQFLRFDTHRQKGTNLYPQGFCEEYM